MNFIKRIFLFILINILVISTITFLLSVFKINPYLTGYGLDVRSLAIICLLWGFTGALISLGLSRILAKWLMGVQLIDENTGDANLKLILRRVEKIAADAGLQYTPQVGIYSSNEVNAFATGPSKKRSLLALSSGLIRNMSQDEIDAIIGHELSHIKNGDMITMTLLQGVVNAFVMFLARILAFFISSMGKEKNRSSSSSFAANYFLIQIFQFVFMILGSIPLAFFSRKREYRADEGSANVLGKEKMIKALNSLKAFYEIKDSQKAHPAFQAFKISNNSKGMANLFATHPPLDDRIERLRNL
ncbi:MAG: protease HtpX [Parachlamydiales bacterium]